jgi:hypothetical protein
VFGDLLDTIGSLEPEELVVRLHAVEGERRRLEAELAALVGALDRTRAYLADGHASVRGLLRADLAWSDAEVANVARTARLVADAPAAGCALWSGAVGVAQVRVLARVRANPRCGGQLADHATELLGLAEKLPFEDFALCVRRWEQLADADGAHRSAEARHDARTASFVEFDGVGHLRATGAALDTAEMMEIWQHYCDTEFTADWEATRAQWGDTASAVLLPRTDAQRRWDALRQIFLDAASTAADAQRPEPTLNILMDAVTFERTLARMRLASEPTSGPLPTLDDLPLQQWRCETTNGVRVDPIAALTVALHGHVRRVVYDSAGNVIDLGRRRRLFTGSAREAVRLQSPRCIWPGCSIPAGRCESDHLNDWQHRGPTRPDNGAPLCPRHNRYKNHGYRVWRDATGHWHTYRPDGTEIGRTPRAGSTSAA